MMDIDRLKTYCEKKLGAPIIPIKLDNHSSNLTTLI